MKREINGFKYKTVIKKKNNVYQISNQLISEVSHFNQMISLFCHEGGCDVVILSITNKSVLTGARLESLKYFDNDI